MNIKQIWRGFLALAICCGITQNVLAEGSSSEQIGGDTLVVVKRIIATDESGSDHVLYQEQSGRIYRLDGIEQAVRDLSSRGISEKGGYRHLRAVLDDTVYIMDANHAPKPARLGEMQMPQVVELNVDSLVVRKDNVIAIYKNNCTVSDL
ncbi:MAG: hypothetical protein P8166_17325 [Candidatus Thiodiazotropha sp.]